MTDTEQGDVEKVARIIDDEAFFLIEHYNGLPYFGSDKMTATEKEAGTFRAYPVLKERRDTAFAKAREIIAALKASPPVGWAPTHRHIKRGTEYQVIDEADLQTDAPLSDYAFLTLYREKNGRIWARPTSEFNDGRFAMLSASPVKASPPALEAGDVEWLKVVLSKRTYGGEIADTVNARIDRIFAALPPAPLQGDQLAKLRSALAGAKSLGFTSGRRTMSFFFESDAAMRAFEEALSATGEE